MKLPLSQSLHFRLPFWTFLGVAVPVLGGFSLAAVQVSDTVAKQAQENLNFKAETFSEIVKQRLKDRNSKVSLLLEGDRAEALAESEVVFVVDGKGQLVASSNSQLLGTKDLSDYPAVEMLQESNSFTFQDENIRWLAAGTRLDNGYSVVAMQQEDRALAAARDFQQRAIAIGILSVILSGMIISLVSKRLCQPLEELTEAAQEMSSGKLNTTAVLRQDEFGILARSLNKVLQRLEETSLEIASFPEYPLQASAEDRSLHEDRLASSLQNLQTKIASAKEGDLTVRAAVTNDELGGIADSYNQMVENLSQIVQKVQGVTQAVSQTSESNESHISQLSADTSTQVGEIADALKQIQNLSESTILVVENAANAEKSIKQATEKVQQGDRAINATAQRIYALQNSTDAAKEQVKQLNKASRKISKAVDLIRKIALQTNVLAVNASIEAARAGREGIGFTVVAEEVQSLATRSAQTASDIEKLVLEIQGETSKVVKAMEQNSKEIAAGSQLIKETCVSLQQVSEASSTIDNLIEDITKIATQQSQYSQNATQTMEQIAATANRNSTSADDVSVFFQDLVRATEELAHSVDGYKVN